MLKVLSSLLFILAAGPIAAQDVVHVRDPFESCERVTENTNEGLTSFKCGSASPPDDAVWLMSFDLGRWRGPYSRFTIEGGRQLETVEYPRASVGSCRRGCTFYQVVSVKIPFDVLFSDGAMRSGLRIKATGGPRDMLLDLSALRIQRFRRGLISAGFIENEDHAAEFTRPFQWPKEKVKESAEPPRGE